MNLGNVRFPGHVFNASGTRGFFGEGYRLPHPGFLANWDGSIFVSKTTTLNARMGSMPMCKDGITPKERTPPCIIVKPVGGHALNSVGLSGPGAEALVAHGRWQLRREPFVISFMAVGDSRVERMDAWRTFLGTMSREKERKDLSFAIELNVACPNAGHDTLELSNEVRMMLNHGAGTYIPIIVCINLLVSPKTALEISRHPACAAVSQSNSIPWGEYPDRIPWKKIFGSDTSPLVARGFKPGGYSGPYALPILLDWIRDARHTNSSHGRRWLIAGGGIQSVEDAQKVLIVGSPILDGIKLGIVGLVRPWRVQSIIRYVNEYFEPLDKRERYD